MSNQGVTESPRKINNIITYATVWYEFNQEVTPVFVLHIISGVKADCTARLVPQYIDTRCNGGISRFRQDSFDFEFFSRRRIDQS